MTYWKSFFNWNKWLSFYYRDSVLHADTKDLLRKRKKHQVLCVYVKEDFMETDVNMKVNLRISLSSSCSYSSNCYSHHYILPLYYHYYPHYYLTNKLHFSVCVHCNRSHMTYTRRSLAPTISSAPGCDRRGSPHL